MIHEQEEISVAQEFAAFVADNSFPCVGAKAALMQDGLSTIEAGDICSSEDDHKIRDALIQQATQVDFEEGAPKSFAVLFKESPDLDEAAFETVLWERLSGLSNIDIQKGTPWSSHSSSDASQPHYAMSVGGHPYFVIGLHPRASRAARRFSRCALVFNSHQQFDAMRADGRYQRFQSINRERELRAFGTINPMLRDFGTASEASQYSGRLVDEAWVCPMAKDVAHD